MSSLPPRRPGPVRPVRLVAGRPSANGQTRPPAPRPQTRATPPLAAPPRSIRRRPRAGMGIGMWSALATLIAILGAGAWATLQYAESAAALTPLTAAATATPA